jgi:molybdenum cofactor guanylyltransferase
MTVKIDIRQDVTGVVLAGGMATRMQGRDKGLVEFRGKALIEYVLAVFAPLNHVLINQNRHATEYARFNKYLIQDEDNDQLERFAGPLSGMLSALKASQTPWVIFSACDTPFLPVDYVACMLNAVEDNVQLCVAVDDTGMQPLHVLMHVTLLDKLTDFLQRGERKTQRFLREAGAREVYFAGQDFFINLNSEEDMQRHR